MQRFLVLAQACAAVAHTSNLVRPVSHCVERPTRTRCIKLRVRMRTCHRHTRRSTHTRMRGHAPSHANPRARAHTHMTGIAGVSVRERRVWHGPRGQNRRCAGDTRFEPSQRTRKLPSSSAAPPLSPCHTHHLLRVFVPTRSVWQNEPELGKRMRSNSF